MLGFQKLAHFETLLKERSPESEKSLFFIGLNDLLC